MRKLAIVSAVAIYIQMVMGGVVVGKDAGFICPDWPLCHGQVMPKLSGLIILELVHRLSALIVTVLVVTIAVLAWRRFRGNRLLLWAATLSVVSLFVQIIVGGLIVILKLPGVTTTIDVANSMFLMCMSVFVVVAARVNRDSENGSLGAQRDPELRGLAASAWVQLGAVGFAVVIGAVFRHTGASEALFGMDSYLASHGQLTPPPLPFSQTMLMFHIIAGIMTAAVVIWFLLCAIHHRRLVRASIFTVVLVGIQVILGVTSLATRLAFLPATMHWGNAALLMGVVSWTAITAHLAAPQEQQHSETEKVSGLVRKRMPEPNPVR